MSLADVKALDANSTLEPLYNAVFGVQAMVQQYKWGSVVG